MGEEMVLRAKDLLAILHVSLTECPDSLTKWTSANVSRPSKSNSALFNPFFIDSSTLSSALNAQLFVATPARQIQSAGLQSVVHQLTLHIVFRPTLVPVRYPVGSTQLEVNLGRELGTRRPLRFSQGYRRLGKVP